jgi:hypothetical protein
MDCRTGGSYHHVHTHANGMRFGFNGVFHEVTAPERIVKTSEFEGLPERGHVVLEITSFEALPSDRTKVTIQSVCRSVVQRDGLLKAGLEPAIMVAHNQLDELLIKGLSAWGCAQRSVVSSKEPVELKPVFYAAFVVPPQLKNVHDPTPEIDRVQPRYG